MRTHSAWSNRTDGRVNVRLIGNCGGIVEVPVRFPVANIVGISVALPSQNLTRDGRQFVFSHVTESGRAVYLEAE